MSFELATLLLSGLNIIILPATVGVGRWLMKIEMRMMRLELRAGLADQSLP